MIAVMTTRPAKAVARRSSIADRSSARGCRITSTTPLRPLKATSAAANPTMIARLTSPPPGSSFAHCTPRYTKPRATAKPGTSHFDLYMRIGICIEDLLNGTGEEPREGDRERQRRRVAARLDRIDRLPRDAHLGREVALRQARGCAQLSDQV